MIVGDDRQAIMGFAGASANALDDMIEELKADVLPLTMTWRCPKAVVALAQRYVPDIQAADEAIEGVVSYATELPAELLATDAILCRNTAPLVDQAYALIRRGIACKVEGREIGTGLLRLVDRWKTIKTVTAFLDKLGGLAGTRVPEGRGQGQGREGPGDSRQVRHVAGDLPRRARQGGDAAQWQR